jgi:hypothetical protein
MFTEKLENQPIDVDFFPYSNSFYRLFLVTEDFLSSLVILVREIVCRNKKVGSPGWFDSYR